MEPFELVRLTQLMSMTRGRRDVVVGVLDGPVDSDVLGTAHAARC
ncbi:hypothetical protein ACFQZ4_47605 [Catellatospora coxensis]